MRQGSSPLASAILVISVLLIFIAAILSFLQRRPAAKICSSRQLCLSAGSRSLPGQVPSGGTTNHHNVCAFSTTCQLGTGCCKDNAWISSRSKRSLSHLSPLSREHQLLPLVAWHMIHILSLKATQRLEWALEFQ